MSLLHYNSLFKKEFAGNFDKETVVHHDLNPPIKARYVMFRPVTWNGHLAMRVELYGCTKGDKRPLFVVFTFNILYMITFF